MAFTSSSPVGEDSTPPNCRLPACRWVTCPQPGGAFVEVRNSPPLTTEHSLPTAVSAPATHAYLRPGPFTHSPPATMEVICPFRFISKALGEAATTAARSLSAEAPPTSPAARTARAASASVEPVVSRSSTSTTRPPASSLRAPSATTSAPARFACRALAPSPAWSATARRCRNAVSNRARVPPRRSPAAAEAAILRAGSCPRRAVARRAEGTGTRSSGPSSPSSPAPARTAAASAPPSAPASPSAPRSLWASSIARTAFSYGAAAWTTGSPGGSGVGLARLGPTVSAAAHASHSSVRGLPQPSQATGSTSPTISRHRLRTVPLCPGGGNPAIPVDNPCGQPCEEPGTPTAGHAPRSTGGASGSRAARRLSPGRPARSLP
ncbi:hypothetical protein F750_2828 [Streptomyces sp. PAMC 26508]|nr:hypothetical protein F750_2828 [Streptomyces sp. PAMC 26508]